MTGRQMKKILLIEDEEGLVISLEDRLQAEGYSVTSYRDGTRGEKAIEEQKWDLVLLDIMLPGKDGYQICRNVRKKNIHIPILMLTARDTNVDTVLGLQLGADDYVSKPFDMQVLLARIDALFRRSSVNSEGKYSNHTVFTFGEYLLNTRSKEVRKKDQLIDLNAQEYRVLEYFVKRPDQVISRDELLDEVWGYDTLTTTRTVDVHIARIRKKLGEEKMERFLRTIRGLGYRFSPSAGGGW